MLQKPQSILIVSPYASVSPHFETELEIAERHLVNGDAVTWLACTGDLPNCDFNAHRCRSRCNDCTLRRSHGWSLLSSSVKSLSLHDRRPIDPEFATLPDLEALQRYTWEGFDIGYAVLSSLVSVLRDPEPDLAKHRDLLNQFYQSARSVFETVREFLVTHDVARVYVFNARFAAMRAVLRAAQQCGVSCHVHERGATLQQFECYRDHLPHDIRAISQLMIEAWNDPLVSQADKIQTSERWFQDRRQRVETNWMSFTKQQNFQEFPPGFDPRRHNLVIFPSSDDEFVAIGDSWKQPLFSGQLEGIKAVSRRLGELSPESRIYLRMHPNLRGVQNQATQAQRQLNLPNLTVIRPEDPVDTYALLDACQTVVTFGSSVGIEACFWGKPSILLGPCFYMDLPGPCRPPDEQSLGQWLLGSLPVPDRLGALMYGYWMGAHGESFRYFQPESWYHGKFKGEVVYAKQPKLSRWQRAFSRFRAVGNR